MSHPIGKYISKDQIHELNHWLRKQGFKQSEENRKSLIWLIDSAKIGLDMDSNEHLAHTELDEYFKENKSAWTSDFKVEDK